MVPVVAVYGANASGKSTLIDAYAFFKKAVQQSQARWLPGAPVPRRPFLLDHTSRDEVSTYAADVLLDGVRYAYGFSVTDHEIVEEWLYSYPKARRRVLFERSAMAMTYGATLGGGKVAAERILRPNSLYLSAAAQSSHTELKPAVDLSHRPLRRRRLDPTGAGPLGSRSDGRLPLSVLCRSGPSHRRGGSGGSGPRGP